MLLFNPNSSIHHKRLHDCIYLVVLVSAEIIFSNSEARLKASDYSTSLFLFIIKKNNNNNNGNLKNTYEKI